MAGIKSGIATVPIREPLVDAPRNSLMPVYLIGGLAVLIRVIVALATHYTSEDFLITLRYAENLAGGNGLVYNLGERVLGTTTPLYTLFLAGLTMFSLPATALGKGCGIAADALLCVVVFRWLSERGYRSVGLIAAGFIAVNPIMIRWAISGMETPLVTLCGIWVWYELSRKRVTAAYGWLAVLFLLRWDSVLLLTVLTAAVLYHERRLPVRGLALYALIILPWLVFAWSYYGSPIPITGHAKMVVYGWRYRGRFFPELSHLGYRFVGTPVYLAVTALAVTGLWRASRERMGWLFAPVAWTALYWVAFLWSKVLLFEWYIPPTLPVYAALVAIGLESLIGPLAARTSKALRYGAASIAVGAVAVWMTVLMISVSSESQRIEDYLRIPIGHYLAMNVGPNERVMLEPIGFIGYYSRCRVLDLVGLVSPEVLPSYAHEIASPFLDMIRRFHPEWILLRPGELQHILDANGVWWQAHYRLHKTFTYTPRPTREAVTFFLFHRSLNTSG